ncbi:pilus assembly FimT family protein [Iodobacter ciconiae]|uniref:Tfp pilus assembly protein FimT n=1 Tax=Iodobacter ciconiae TaxID=2496266 RepID=A0A3S8ZQL7_9NEIS|nr:hypothetical protein [Iodobacter ciconiae]AZN35742.1 hypothetical protein EJO50_04170 [Iodobacter ciconiae]
MLERPQYNTSATTAQKVLSMRKYLAFSLIKLTISLIVLSIILISVVIPGFTGVLQRHRLQNAALEAQNGWLFARSTAVKLGAARSPAVFYVGKRLNNHNWSLQICTATPCTEGSTILRQQRSKEHKDVELISLSNALKENKFHNYNGLPNFTQQQFILFQSGKYRLQLQITTTGSSTLCRPKNSPPFGEYAECI